MTLALIGRIMISANPNNEHDQASRENRKRSNGRHRGRHDSAQSLVSTGVGEITGRILNVEAERVTFDEGTVLSVPWLTARTSKLLKAGAVLTVKYEHRGREKVVAFVEVTSNPERAPDSRHHESLAVATVPNRANGLSP